MAKGMYDYIQQAWKKPDVKVLRERMTEWRKGESIVKVDKPLRLDRARAVGYKAKKGIIVVRVRIARGGRTRPRPMKGRKHGGNLSSRKILKMSYQWVAEQRAAMTYTNLEVLNSYEIGKDGENYFFEVIMIDPERAEIKSDSNLKWICNSAHRGRVFRGLTSAGKKSRGLSTKSHEMKVRPSLRAWGNRGK
jgi:large subunit ribosomal protein L15e